VEELANELVAIASEHGFALFLGRGLIVQGWAIAQRGQSGLAVCQIREGLAAVQATGSRSFEPIFLGLLAEALALTGEIEEGLAVIADALAKTEASGAKENDAELHRLRGDLLHRLPSPDWTEVEASLRMALAIACEQGTRGFELRAAISLARLWGEQGRRGEAGDLLAPVYGWFTEGFDTVDMKEAKALLDELA
jgi:predicted ATPase